MNFTTTQKTLNKLILPLFNTAYSWHLNITPNPKENFAEQTKKALQSSKQSLFQHLSDDKGTEELILFFRNLDTIYDFDGKAIIFKNDPLMQVIEKSSIKTKENSYKLIVENIKNYLRNEFHTAKRNDSETYNRLEEISKKENLRSEFIKTYARPLIEKLELDLKHEIGGEQKNKTLILVQENTNLQQTVDQEKPNQNTNTQNGTRASYTAKTINLSDLQDPLTTELSSTELNKNTNENFEKTYKKFNSLDESEKKQVKIEYIQKEFGVSKETAIQTAEEYKFTTIKIEGESNLVLIGNGKITSPITNEDLEKFSKNTAYLKSDFDIHDLDLESNSEFNANASISDNNAELSPSKPNIKTSPAKDTIDEKNKLLDQNKDNLGFLDKQNTHTDKSTQKQAEPRQNSLNPDEALSLLVKMPNDAFSLYNPRLQLNINPSETDVEHIYANAEDTHDTNYVHRIVKRGFKMLRHSTQEQNFVKPENSNIRYPSRLNSQNSELSKQNTYNRITRDQLNNEANNNTNLNPNPNNTNQTNSNISKRSNNETSSDILSIALKVACGSAFAGSSFLLLLS